MVKEIQFPGWSVSGFPAATAELLLVCGGRLPSSHWLKEVALGRSVWGVDRGFHALLEAGILPIGVTGDLDSLSTVEAEKLLQMQIVLDQHEKDKDFTDLELALIRSLEELPQTSHIWLVGGFGGRMDHLLGNLRVLSTLKKQQKPVGGLIDDKEALLFVEAGERISISFDRLPKIVSMIPLSNKIYGASLEGCHWTLPKGDWLNTEMPPISNRVAEGNNQIEFSLEAGLAGVYFCWDEQGL